METVGYGWVRPLRQSSVRPALAALSSRNTPLKRGVGLVKWVFRLCGDRAFPAMPKGEGTYVTEKESDCRLFDFAVSAQENDYKLIEIRVRLSGSRKTDKSDELQVDAVQYPYPT